MGTQPSRRSQVTKMPWTQTTLARAGVVFLCLFGHGLVVAQSPVEDRSIRPPSALPQIGGPGASNIATEIFVEQQQMREELSMLRGLVEEYAHRLEQLETQQRRDYENLDARLRQGAGADSSESGSSPSTNVSVGSSAAAPVTGDGSEEYNNALGLLRGGNQAGALTAFAELVRRYPVSPVAADSYYWMGETHWVAGSYEDAREAYSGLVSGFPNHRRYGESLYKLGRVYHQLNDRSTAERYLNQAVTAGGDSGARAAELLREIRLAN